MTNSTPKLAAVLVLIMWCYSASANSLPDGLNGFKLGMNPEQARSQVDRLVNGKNPKYECKDDFELHPAAFKCEADLPGVSYFGMPVKGVTIVFVNNRVELLSLAMDAYTPADRNKSTNEVLKGLKPYLPSDYIFADGTWFSPAEEEGQPLSLMYGSDYVWQLLKAFKERADSNRSAQK